MRVIKERAVYRINALNQSQYRPAHEPGRSTTPIRGHPPHTANQQRPYGGEESERFLMSAQVTPNRTPHPAHFDYTDFSTMHRIKHFPSIVGRYANLPPQTSLKICIPGIPFQSRLFGETGGNYYNMRLYYNTQYYRYINPHAMMTTPVPTPLPVVQLRSARKSRSVRITRILLPRAQSGLTAVRQFGTLVQLRGEAPVIAFGRRVRGQWGTAGTQSACNTAQVVSPNNPLKGYMRHGSKE